MLVWVLLVSHTWDKPSRLCREPIMLPSVWGLAHTCQRLFFLSSCPRAHPQHFQELLSQGRCWNHRRFFSSLPFRLHLDWMRGLLMLMSWALVSCIAFCIIFNLKARVFKINPTLCWLPNSARRNFYSQIPCPSNGEGSGAVEMNVVSWAVSGSAL